MMPTGASARRMRLCGSIFGLILALTVPTTTAIGDWDRLPDPPDVAPLQSFTFDGSDTWLGVIPISDSGPFAVADNAHTLYVGNLGGYSFYRGVPIVKSWMSLNTSSWDFTPLKVPDTLDPAFLLCYIFCGNGRFVDGSIFIEREINRHLAEYLVTEDNWIESPWTGGNENYDQLGSTIATDNEHEILYWLGPTTTWSFPSSASFSRVDPEAGIPSIDTVEFNGLHLSAGLGVWDNKLYITGGLKYEYTKVEPPWEFPTLTGSENADIYNYITQDFESMKNLPHPAMMVGSGWGTDGLHFVGFQVKSTYWFIDPVIHDSQIWHFVYDPETDAWQTLENDIPENCLPTSVTQQGPWLYGVFNCYDAGDYQVRLYRKEIGEYGVTTTTTTTNNLATTTTTQPASDDDAQDDDTIDDDSADGGSNDVKPLGDDPDSADEDDNDRGSCG